MMKKLILVFGVLGLASMFIPTHGMMLFSMFQLMGTMQLVLMLAAFAVPTIMAAMAINKPMLQWQAFAAAAGFVLACVKLEVWRTLPHIGQLIEIVPMFLMVIAAVAGAVVSIIAAVKPEASA
jgi:hypothetical protein